MFVCQENLWVLRLRFALLGYGFRVWLGSGFRVCILLEIDYREEHGKNTNNEKKIE